MSHLSIELQVSAAALGLQGGEGRAGILQNGGGNAPGGAQAAPVALAGGVGFHMLPGDTVAGNLVVTAGNKEIVLNEKGIEFYLRGYERTSITVTVQSGKHSHQETSWGGGDFFKFIVPVDSANKTYAAGTVTKYPFNFILPQITPHTTVVELQYEGRNSAVQVDEEPAQCCAYSTGIRAPQRANAASLNIRYEIKALAHVKGIFSSNLVGQVELIIDPVYSRAITPQALLPVSAEGTKQFANFLCMCFGFRTVSAVVRVPKRCFMNGEAIPMEVEIDNKMKAQGIDQIIVAMQNEMDIRVPYGHMRESRRYVTIARNVYSCNVPAGSKSVVPLTFVAQNQTPDITTVAATCRTSLLVRIHIKGEAMHHNLRIPLEATYVTDNGLPFAAYIPQSYQQEGPMQPPAYGVAAGQPVAAASPYANDPNTTNVAVVHNTTDENSPLNKTAT